MSAQMLTSGVADEMVLAYARAKAERLRTLSLLPPGSVAVDVHVSEGGWHVRLAVGPAADPVAVVEAEAPVPFAALDLAEVRMRRLLDRRPASAVAAAS
jgi:hypothetical protein